MNRRAGQEEPGSMDRAERNNYNPDRQTVQACVQMMHICMCECMYVCING